MLVEGVCLEETNGCDCCDCERQTLPFRFSYFFSKDPCEKCLVRAACDKDRVNCELKYSHWDRTQSVAQWKRKWARRIHTPLSISTIAFIMTAALLLIIVNSGCRQVNQERAVQYYDQNVKNFPEENP